MPYLSVVISAYNESRNFKQGALTEALDFLKKQKYSWEMILVNDGSTDNTLDLLTQFAHGQPNIRVINNPHMGKAAGIITGALAARGQIILFTDMDQSTPLTEFSKFVSKFESGAQIVIGSRADRKGAPLFRQVLAYGNVVMRFLILRLPYLDTQCGFKAFTQPAAQKIFSIMKSVHPLIPVNGPAVNPGFDVELLYIGRKLGLKIDQVKVAWQYKVSDRVDFLGGVMSGIKDLLTVRFRALSNAYHL
jgi:hypothetical protein